MEAEKGRRRDGDCGGDFAGGRTSGRTADRRTSWRAGGRAWDMRVRRTGDGSGRADGREGDWADGRAREWMSGQANGRACRRVDGWLDGRAWDGREHRRAGWRAVAVGGLRDGKEIEWTGWHAGGRADSQADVDGVKGRAGQVRGQAGEQTSEHETCGLVDGWAVAEEIVQRAHRGTGRRLSWRTVGRAGTCGWWADRQVPDVPGRRTGEQADSRTDGRGWGQTGEGGNVPDRRASGQVGDLRVTVLSFPKWTVFYLIRPCVFHMLNKLLHVKTETCIWYLSHCEPFSHWFVYF